MPKRKTSNAKLTGIDAECIVSLDDNDMNNLRHMLGVGSHIAKREWGYRNHFAPGGDNIKSMERLETAGLVRRGRPYRETHYYHATEKGCKAAGLNKKQTNNAMGG